MLRGSWSRADNISDVKHYLLGGMCDIVGETRLRVSIVLDWLRGVCVRVAIMLWRRVGGNIL